MTPHDNQKPKTVNVLNVFSTKTKGRKMFNDKFLMANTEV